MNKLKTKLNSFFDRMASNTKRIHNFWRNFPKLAKKMPSKVLFVSKKTRRPFAHLRAKIVWIVGPIKWVKNHLLCAQLSQCFWIYYNNYSPQCRWLVVCIYLEAYRLANYTTSHLHLSKWLLFISMIRFFRFNKGACYNQKVKQQASNIH